MDKALNYFYIAKNFEHDIIIWCTNLYNIEYRLSSHDFNCLLMSMLIFYYLSRSGHLRSPLTSHLITLPHLSCEGIPAYAILVLPQETDAPYMECDVCVTS